MIVSHIFPKQQKGGRLYPSLFGDAEESVGFFGKSSKSVAKKHTMGFWHGERADDDA